MANQDDYAKQKDSIEFMVAEYEHHAAEFRRSEELGESRMNLFLTIVTLYYEPCDDTPKREWKCSRKEPFGNGGLVETIMLVNTVIFVTGVIIFFILIFEFFYIMVLHRAITLICAILILAFSLYLGGWIWKTQSDIVQDKYKEGEPDKINIKYPCKEISG
jgi:hypothetical protein